MLPEFTKPGSLPAATGLGTGFRLADEVWEMGPYKSGYGAPMALEGKAEQQFIGHQLKIGRLLQGDKGFEELDRFGRPVWPVAAAGELWAEHGPVLEPPCAEAVKVGRTNAQEAGGFGGINLVVVKLLEQVLEERGCEAFGQLSLFHC